MLSKAKIKLINQLSQKKYRNQTGLFIAEGHKTVGDMMEYFTPEYLYYTSDYNGKKTANESCEVTYDELKKISRLETPQNVLAVFKMPVYDNVAINPDELTLALDGIQDAGNMGTIIRIADWFGINNIFASKNTVDVYNPKVVQATMGALSRVRVNYVDLVEELSRLDAPIYVTANVLMNGSVSTDTARDAEEAQEFKDFIQSIKPSDFSKLMKDNDHHESDQ